MDITPKILFIAAALAISFSARCRETLPLIGKADTATQIVVNSQSSLNMTGIELTRQMHSLACDKRYVELCTTSGEVTEIIDEIARQKYDTPLKILSINNLQMPFTDTLNLKTNTLKIINDRMIKSIPSILNSQSGASMLAATSLLHADSIFLSPKPKDYAMYLYIYAGKYHSMMILAPRSNSIVQACAYFVTHPMLNEIKTADDVKRFCLEILNIDNVTVKEE